MNRAGPRKLFGAALIGAAACAIGLAAMAAGIAPAGEAAHSWNDFLPPSVLAVLFVLLALSAFFSSSETAFFAIPMMRLRAMRKERGTTTRLIVKMLDNPASLLTTILVGNMLVNVMIVIVLGTRASGAFEHVAGLSSPAAYAAAIVTCTSVLLFFGEIVPKVFAVRAQESYARVVAIPLLVIGKMIAPLRDALLRLTDALFRVTRFNELRAAPFITDVELKSALTGDDATAVIEEDGRRMIRRILEFREATLREVLVPRTDVVAIPEDATVGEALVLFRENEYSRVPVFREDLDHIAGFLFAKDLLRGVSEGGLGNAIRELVHPPCYVPKTMSIQAFVEEAQRLRSHIAIVVDEFGGTEGIVTLQDAIEEVVGDISDEHDEVECAYERIADGVYRVPGSLHLDELSDLIGIAIEDEEHETLAGFLMDRSEKIPSAGDRIRDADVTFTVEEVDGKRASTIRIEIAPRDGEEAS